ncbi:hypothetical protein J6590_093911 [Homalodisca vitripennis]|nr:hypothetical protein J6590_093911 [Homalodisca vitripennis]
MGWHLYQSRADKRRRKSWRNSAAERRAEMRASQQPLHVPAGFGCAARPSALLLHSTAEGDCGQGVRGEGWWLEGVATNCDRPPHASFFQSTKIPGSPA